MIETDMTVCVSTCFRIYGDLQDKNIGQKYANNTDFDPLETKIFNLMPQYQLKTSQRK